MKKLILLAVAALMLNSTVLAQDFTPSFKYRITLKDKKHNPYSLSRPEEFLSKKSIERRTKQGLKLDETDLPVSPEYLSEIRATGAIVCSTSKWNNTVLVELTDTSKAVVMLRNLTFVSSIRKVATYMEAPSRNKTNRFRLISEKNINESDAIHNSSEEWLDSEYYGEGFTQINQLNGISLHRRGFRGAGMTIAIIDGGFYNADIIPMLKNVNILGVADFAERGTNVYEEGSHGMMVLSCMATNHPGTFVGTAPEASYWLIRSEDSYSEQMAEEDNWCAAVEFADSVGADLVNTSLGYSKYDNEADNVRYWEMDGHKRLCSNSASMLAGKGMVLCNSAGNEASKTWKLISIPADADDVLTVGAVRSNGINTNFSSLGNSADGRIKPDVMAMGEACTVLSTRGELTTASGTSFASPIMCGMVACFWQANPKLTALEVVQKVRLLGDNVAHPDNVFGYGIPDFSKK